MQGGWVFEVIELVRADL